MLTGKRDGRFSNQAPRRWQGSLNPRERAPARLRDGALALVSGSIELSELGSPLSAILRRATEFATSSLNNQD